MTATLALFVALGGTGYAVTELAADSVGPRELRRGAVRSPEVANRSLRTVDFARGQVPRGRRGVPGAAKAYARVNADGTVAAEQSKGNPTVKRVSPGRYCVGVTVELSGAAKAASPVYTTPSNTVVTPIGEDALTAAVTTDRAAIDTHCAQAASAGDLLVTLRDARTGTETDAPFYAAFN
jgi:hypothetical protein